MNLQISYLLMITPNIFFDSNLVSDTHHAVAAARRGSEEEAKHETIKSSRRENLF